MLITISTHSVPNDVIGTRDCESFFVSDISSCDPVILKFNVLCVLLVFSI